MRVKAKDAPTSEMRRSVDDGADRGIAVFHWRGKIALLKRTPHQLVLAPRNASGEDEAFGAAADAANARANENLAGHRRPQLRGANLALARCREPEGARRYRPISQRSSIRRAHPRRAERGGPSAACRVRARRSPAR